MNLTVAVSATRSSGVAFVMLSYARFAGLTFMLAAFPRLAPWATFFCTLRVLALIFVRQIRRCGQRAERATDPSTSLRAAHGVSRGSGGIRAKPARAGGRVTTPSGTGTAPKCGTRVSPEKPCLRLLRRGYCPHFPFFLQPSIDVLGFASRYFRPRRLTGGNSVVLQYKFSYERS